MIVLQNNGLIFISYFFFFSKLFQAIVHFCVPMPENYVLSNSVHPIKATLHGVCQELEYKFQSTLIYITCKQEKRKYTLMRQDGFQDRDGGVELQYRPLLILLLSSW